MSKYVWVHACSMPVLLGTLWLQAQPWGSRFFVYYFAAFWTVFLASAVILFFVCMEVFRSALAPFSGLTRFGIVIFRWIIAVSVIATLASLTSIRGNLSCIPMVATQLGRAVAVLELCLLAFLCVTMNALKLSVRDMSFGISLGFGVMSAGEFVTAALMSIHTSLDAPLQYFYQGATFVALGTWLTYALLPQVERKPIVMSANSTIYRWNEIASALGHKAPTMPPPQPANSFFLTDVEKVVEKVLTRNLKGSETNS